MLSEDDKISFDEMVQYKLSTRMELADRILDDLIPATRKLGGELARRSADVLSAWDRQANADSRGAVLFAFWAKQMHLNDKSFSKPWSQNFPRTTPDGFVRSQIRQLQHSKLLLAIVEKAYGKLDIAWGDVFRLHINNTDLPANGGDENLGIFRAVGFAPASGGHFRADHGDSFVAAIEFSQPVKAMGLIGYGNATQPGSPHTVDQLQLFANKQLRSVWRDRQEILAHLEERKVF